MRWRRYCLHSHAVGGCHIPGANRLGTLLPACVLRGPRSSLHKTGAKKIHSDSLLGTRLYCLHSAVFIHVRPARAREPIGAGTRTSKRSFKAPAMYLRGSAIHPQCCGTRMAAMTSTKCHRLVLCGTYAERPRPTLCPPNPRQQRHR